MKKKTVISLLILVALLFVVVPSAYADNGNGEREPWYGDPDPMACGEFDDCYEIIAVCIDGATYEIGIYDDLIGATPEEIEEAALLWSDTVLTYGACPPPPLVRRYRMVTLIDPDAPDWFLGQDARNGTCWVKMPTSQGLPSVEQQHRICNYNDGEFVYEDYVADGSPLYDAWVMINPVTGEVFYPDPMWDPVWFDPDYTTVEGPPIG